MAAADALAILVDPENLVTNTVTIPEGLRVDDIVDDPGREAPTSPGATFEKVARRTPTQLGLPDYAEGNPEGYLFPSTYDFGPKETPVDMLTRRWSTAGSRRPTDADLEARPRSSATRPAELMTIASLVEAEGRGDDMPKVARVIYNRLETGRPRPTACSRSTRPSTTPPTTSSARSRPRRTSSSTRRTTPTRTPACRRRRSRRPATRRSQAAANPADGDWYYYVTVNLATGETKFAETYDEFLEYKQELRDYCENESEGAC